MKHDTAMALSAVFQRELTPELHERVLDELAYELIRLVRQRPDQGEDLIQVLIVLWASYLGLRPRMPDPEPLGSPLLRIPIVSLPDAAPPT